MSNSEQNLEKVQERQAEIASNAPMSEASPTMADNSASMGNAPAKRGRGRPRKDGTPVKTGGLRLGFKSDSGDKNPPKPSDALGSNASAPLTPVIDYSAVATGLVNMIDGCMKVVSMVTKGKIEYEPLEANEKKICATALEQEKGVLEFMGKTSGINHMIVLATLAGVFMPKIKVKPSESKKDKDGKPIKKEDSDKVKQLTTKDEISSKSDTSFIVAQAPSEKVDMEL